MEEIERAQIKHNILALSFMALINNIAENPYDENPYDEVIDASS